MPDEYEVPAEGRDNLPLFRHTHEFQAVTGWVSRR